MKLADTKLRDRWRGLFPEERAYVIVWLIAVLAVIACAIFGSGCSVPRVRFTPADSAFTVQDAHNAAVTVHDCGWIGSGVIVGPSRVVTAAHVLGHPCAFIVVETNDGKRYRATKEQAWGDDVATLKIAGTLKQKPPRRGTIGVGSRTCLYSAAPYAARRCGAVRSVAQEVGGIAHSAKTIPGNSGAGLYSMGGELVGIVVWYLEDGSGGMATPIGNRLEAAP